MPEHFPVNKSDIILFRKTLRIKCLHHMNIIAAAAKNDTDFLIFMTDLCRFPPKLAYYLTVVRILDEISPTC